MKVLLTTVNSKFIHPNLALRWLYVARDPSFETILKEFNLRDSIDFILQELDAINPDMIFFSVYIWNAEIIQAIIREYHASHPSVKLYVGGPEVTYKPDLYLSLPIEALMRGEGEKAVWQIARGEDPTTIDGYLSKTVQSQCPYATVDLQWLESLESPYFLEMDCELAAHRYLYIETMRGCPYRCSYCLSSATNGVRYFSDDYVFKILERLAHLPSHYCKQVKFLDRTFNSNPKRALAIAKKIAALPVDYSFQFEVTADTLSEEILSFLENLPNGLLASRFRFEIGVQSFNKMALEAVNRHHNTPQLVANIQRLKKAGAHSHVDLIAGLPYEDLESFKKSFYRLFGCKAGELQVGILKLLSGTPLATPESINKYGFEYSAEAPYNVLKTNWLSKEDLIEIDFLYHATERFYNNGRCAQSLETLYDLGYPIFDILVECGKEVQKLFPDIQIRDQFLIFYHAVLNHSWLRGVQCNGAVPYRTISNSELKSLLLVDYYKASKKRPKPLFGSEEENLDSEVVRHVYEALSHQLTTINLDQLYHYAKVFKGWGVDIKKDTPKGASFYQIEYFGNEQRMSFRLFSI